MWSKEENEQLKENILEYCKVRELEIGGRWGCSQMVSALNSGLRGPCSRPGWVKVLCSLAKCLTFTVPLSIQEYKWVPMNCQESVMKWWGITLRWTCIPDPSSGNK